VLVVDGVGGEPGRAVVRHGERRGFAHYGAVVAGELVPVRDAVAGGAHGEVDPGASGVGEAEARFAHGRGTVRALADRGGVVLEDPVVRPLREPQAGGEVGALGDDADRAGFEDGLPGARDGHRHRTGARVVPDARGRAAVRAGARTPHGHRPPPRRPATRAPTVRPHRTVRTPGTREP